MTSSLASKSFSEVEKVVLTNVESGTLHHSTVYPLPSSQKKI